MQKVDDIVWDLSELHDSVLIEDAQSLMAAISTQADQFVATKKGRILNFSSQELLLAISEFEAIKSKLSQLSQFSHLNYAVDMQDGAILKLVTKSDEFCSIISNKLLFFFLEIGSVGFDKLADWLRDECLVNYRYCLTQAVEKNKYRLSEKEEQLVNLKDLNGSDAFRKLYSEHTSRYEFKMMIDGEEKVMNGTQCRALRYHKDPSVRREAMRLFYDAYESDAHVMTHLFNTVIKDYNIERELRGYETPISTMNIGNDLPNELVDMLHNITTDSNVLVQRYYKMKQQILGLDDMTLADIYAPMKDDLPKVSWSEAKSIVLQSFEAFDSDFYSFAKDMFDRDRLHVFPSKVKRGGAFCSSSHPNVRPFVMLNHLDKQRDVATLAHELGHAIHAYFSSEQPLINYHAILPICETASVFSEMLVIDELKKRCKTPEEKMILLTTNLEDIFATSHRQNMFSRFEQVIHDNIMNVRLSADELCNFYTEELKRMFGDSVRIPEEYRWEWSTIPHMLDVPFYVYSYNFGNLLVLGLYQLYLEQGQSFIPVLKRILSAGSSVAPVELLGREGIDITNEGFWLKSIDFINAVVDELEFTISEL